MRRLFYRVSSGIVLAKELTKAIGLRIECELHMANKIRKNALTCNDHFVTQKHQKGEQMASMLRVVEQNLVTHSYLFTAPSLLSSSITSMVVVAIRVWGNVFIF
ncbi:hypothetical protein CB1_012719015 [Camelus ferus]|nr:hypothetical protein CB1_012719015 [Camelus ferus]